MQINKDCIIEEPGAVIKTWFSTNQTWSFVNEQFFSSLIYPRIIQTQKCFTWIPCLLKASKSTEFAALPRYKYGTISLGKSLSSSNPVSRCSESELLSSVLLDGNAGVFVLPDETTELLIVSSSIPINGTVTFGSLPDKSEPEPGLSSKL